MTDGAERDDRELLLQIPIATAELQEFGHGGRLETLLVQGLNHGTRAHILVEVTQDHLALVHLVRLEVAIIDIGVDVGVLTLLDEVFDTVSEDVQPIADDLDHELSLTTQEAMDPLHATKLVKNGFGRAKIHIGVLVGAHDKTLSLTIDQNCSLV